MKLRKMIEWIFPSLVIKKEKISIGEQLEHLGGLWRHAGFWPRMHRIAKICSKKHFMKKVSDGGYMVPSRVPSKILGDSTVPNLWNSLLGGVKK